MTDSIRRNWLREPLVHFLGLAALLFVANAWFAGDEREVITVDADTQDYLIEQQQSLLLRELTEEEKDQIVQDFVTDEILVREARQRGFENSSRIRTLLIQNMRFFMAADIPEPTDEELRAYFQENKDRFTSQPTINFQQVLFTIPEEAPDDLLGRLNAGEDHESLGDADMLNRRIIGAGEAAILGAFGAEQGADILDIGDGGWHGPFLSDQGAHYLRIEQRNPPRTPSWEMAQNWIGTEWLAAKNREIVDREMGAMRENYRIEIEPRGETAP